MWYPFSCHPVGSGGVWIFPVKKAPGRKQDAPTGTGLPGKTRRRVRPGLFNRFFVGGAAPPTKKRLAPKALRETQTAGYVFAMQTEVKYWNPAAETMPRDTLEGCSCNGCGARSSARC